MQAALAAIPGVAVPSEIREPAAHQGLRASGAGAGGAIAEQLEPRAPPVGGSSTIDVGGAELATLAEQAATPGTKSCSPSTPVQKAAEAALASMTEPAVLVAIQPSTGEILAVAQNTAANAQGPIALTGQYPPGSTFKIVTGPRPIDRKLITPTTPGGLPGRVHRGRADDPQRRIRPRHRHR